MAPEQFENSRISEGTLRTERRASQAADPTTTDSEISNMIAEGSPASRESSIAPKDRPRIRCVVAASTLIGNRVLMTTGEELGNIEEIMLDLRSGRIAYAVLSFSGFPGIIDKRFPVPWNALRIDSGEQDFVLDIDRKTLEGVPHFDKDDWPDMADPASARVVNKQYGMTADSTSETRLPYEQTTGYPAETRH